MLHYAYHLTVQSDLVVQAECYSPGDQIPDRITGKIDANSVELVRAYLSLVDSKVELGRNITEKIGEFLYRTLFSGKISGHFENLVWRKIQSKSTENFATLTLAFQDGVPPDLAALPWEFLFEPESQSFLATDVNVAFYYRRPDWALLPSQSFDKNLRILLVRMQPVELSSVALTRLKNFLNQKVDEQVALIAPVVLDNPSIAELEKVLKECRPHILHFLAHGYFDDSGSRFALVGDDGTSERWFGDKSFAEIISAYAPKLVLLQACEGGKLSDVHTFANGAAWLVRHNVPAVLAMRYPITNATGWIFGEKLYDELLAGASIDYAVQLGRRALAFGDKDATASHASRNFAAPMLWLRAEKEEKKMFTTIQIKTPDENLFEADVPLDLPVGILLRELAGSWESAFTGPAKRLMLRRKKAEGPFLPTSLTLREVGVTGVEKLFLYSEFLQPSMPIGLTIEDDDGQHYTTAVLLSTTIRQLVDAFLEQHSRHGEPVVQLVEAGNRRLPLDKTLHEAGVNDNSTLRIYQSNSGEGEQK